MTNFKIKKEEYLARMQGEDLETKIGKNNVNPRLANIILDPQNEEEIRIAENTVYTLNNIVYISDNPQIGDYKTCTLTTIIIGLIDALKNHDKEKEDQIKHLLRTLDPTEAAHLVYELYGVFGHHRNEAIDYIATETGFNTTDDSFKYFNFLFTRVAKIISVESTEQIDFCLFNPDDKEELAYFYMFTSEFNLLCLRSKLKNKQMKKEA